MSEFANVYTGAAANDLTGDPLRNAFQKINLNFANISSGNANITINAPVRSVAGRTGIVALTVNDVYGAASVAYVNSATDAANLYIDTIAQTIDSANIASLGNTVAQQAVEIASISNTSNLAYDVSIANQSNIASLEFQMYGVTTSLPEVQSNVVILQDNTANLAAATTILFSDVIRLTGNVNQIESTLTTKANVFGNVAFSGNMVLTSLTRTNGPYEGALVIADYGGAYVGGNVNIQEQLFIGQGAQESRIRNALTVERGTSSTGPSTQYTQHGIINLTNTGSTDIIVYPDNYSGPETDRGFMDMGVTGSRFNDERYTITKPNDGYLFASAADNIWGGNLVIATDEHGSYNDIVIGVGSFYSNAEVARFHGNTNTVGGAVLTMLGNIVADTVIANVPFTAANVANWNSTVTTVAEALDELAMRLRAAGY